MLADPAEQPDRERHADRAAVKRHPAVPEIERLDRVREIIGRIVEQHVAEPAAEHDAERRPDQEIVDVAAAARDAAGGRRARGNTAIRAAGPRYRRARTSGSQRVRPRSRPGRWRETGSRKAASAPIVRGAGASGQARDAVIGGAPPARQAGGEQSRQRAMRAARACLPHLRSQRSGRRDLDRDRTIGGCGAPRRARVFASNAGLHSGGGGGTCSPVGGERYPGGQVS